MKLKILKSAGLVIIAMFFVNVFVLPAQGQSIPTNPSGTGGTLKIVSGTGSFSSISAANKILNVSPGATLSGTVNLQAFVEGCDVCVVPLIWTPSWGDDNTSWQLISGWIPNSGYSSQTANMSLTAPSSPGVYHIIFAFEWEIGGDHVASGSNWGLGYDVWNDGNDIAEFNATQISSAQLNGYALDEWLYGGPNGTTQYEQQYVPSDAITLVVAMPSPQVTTGAASAVTANSATLNGSVNPNGSSTTAVFQWGTSTSYGNTVPNPALSCGSGNNTIGVSVQNLSGLSPNATYHYRLVATSSAGTAYGADQSFTTGKTPPTISSVSPSPLQAPRQAGQTLTGTFVIRGQNFQGGFVTTDGPLLLTGSAQVSPDGTSIEQNYQIGCCAPYQGETFHLTVNTAGGTATIQDSITLSSQSLSSVSGKILSPSGQGIGGASVQIGTATTTSASDGSYAITGLSIGNYPVTVSAIGYTILSSTLTVPASATLSQNFTLSPASSSGSPPIVTSITTQYSPNEEALYFLDGVTFPVTFTATVNWDTHSAGTVQFITPNNGIVVGIVSGNTATSQPIDIGHAFGPGGKLQVQAISSDGTSSIATVANFVVMSALPLQNFGLFNYVDEGNQFYYQSQTATDIQFLEDSLSGDDDGVEVDPSIPFFGGNPIDLGFTPSITAKITGDNLELFELSSDAPLSLDVADAEFDVSLSQFDIFANYDTSSQDWVWGGNMAFSADLSEPLAADAGVVLVGPIPVVLYYEANLGLSVPDANLNFSSFYPALSWSGNFVLNPTLSGSVGAISIVSAVGWISGGPNLYFQYPQTPHLYSYDVQVNGAVTIYALLWSVANYPLEWKWPPNQNSSLQALTLVTPSQPISLHPYPRDYLKQPAYAAFNGKPKTGFKPLFKPLGQPSSMQNPLLYALQTQIFPFSEPSLSASGTNCYAVWLYDNPSRSANNQTMLVFSEFDGTQWSAFSPVADDGTADFHPQLRTFADGSAVVAWENEGTVLSANANFTAMITNLEIATAFYDPVAGAWQPMQQLTTNNYLDQNPRIAGESETNLMLVWVANTNNDLEGSATNVNQLWFTTWNGSSWSTPQMFASVPYPLLKYDMTYDGTNAYVVMSLDSDNTLTNMNANELFEVAYQNGSWSGLTQLTTNQVPDNNPQIAIDPYGNIVLVWLQGGELSSVVNFNFANQQVISTNQYSSNLGDFTLANSSDGRLAIVWAEPSPQYPSDLYGMFYDPNFEVWGNPKQLTDDPETELETAATFYSTNQLIALYDRMDIAIGDTNQTDSVITNTDLYVLQYQLTNNLVLVANSLTVSPANPAPGDTVTLSVMAENLGDSGVSNVLVAFYQGDPNNGGTEIGQTNLALVLVPGTTNVVSILWPVPTTTNPLLVYAVIDPDQQYPESDLQNEKINNTFVEPDLVVQSVTWGQIASNLLSVTATVINQGTIPSQPATGSFLLNSLTGTNLFSTNIVSLAPGQSIDVNYIWNVSNLGNGVSLFAVVNTGTNADFNPQDEALELTIQPNITQVNVQLGPITVLPDGSVQVSMTGLAGQTYLVEVSTDQVNWSTLTEVTLTNGVGQFVDTSTNDFYQAVVLSRAQPQLGVPQFSTGGTAQVSVTGLAEQTYIIESSTNLVNWVPIYTNGGSFVFTDPNSTNFNQQFYRAVLP